MIIINIISSNSISISINASISIIYVKKDKEGREVGRAIREGYDKILSVLCFPIISHIHVIYIYLPVLWLAKQGVESPPPLVS